MKLVSISFFFFLSILFTSSIFAQNDPFQTVLTASVDTEKTNLNASIQEEEIIIETLNSVEALRLLKKTDADLYFIDIRDSYKEFESFHIKGAKWVGSEFSTEKIWYLHRTSTLVIYGNPASDPHKYACQLRAVGFKDVRSFEGAGIVDWIKDGNVVVNIYGEPTTKYKFEDKTFSKMLK